MDGLPLIGEPSFFILLIIILAAVSIVLSVASLLLVRSAARKMASSPQPVTPSVAALPALPLPSPKPVMPKPGAAAKATAKAEVKPAPPPPRPLESLEIKPAEAGEEFGFTSLEEVASMLGIRSVILLNQSGMPVDSYNVGEGDRVAASVADFIYLIRRLNPGFSYMVSEGDQRVMLFLVGRIGESEIYALTVGCGPEFGIEEVRDLLRVYLSESLGRFK
jgi:hypothetical protein